MAGLFTTGGNPFNQDPLALLSTATQAGEPTTPVQAPMYADPQTTGSVTAGAPAQAASNTGGFDLGSIGNRISDAFSGRGLFGGQADDNEIDPMTGAPKGLARQAGMRSMMQMGLTFLLAGQRMSNDQRAAILSKAPGLIGGGDDALNSFAKTRLEMAKLRMEQQKMQQEQASNQALMGALGMGGSSGGTAPAPSAGAQAIQQSQAQLAQTAPAVAAGDPSQASSAPVAGGETTAPAPVPASISSPGGVPRMAPAQQATGSSDDPKNWTHAEKLAILAQPTTGGKANAFLQIQQNRAAGVRMGPVQYDQTTGEQYALTMDGRGNVTGRTALGKPQITTRDTEDGNYREKGYKDPVTGQFVVTDRSDIAEKPAEAEDRRLASGVLRDNYKDINGEYTGNVQKAAQRYDRLASIREDVLAGKGIFGTGAATATQVVKALGSAGLLPQKYVDDLVTNDNFMRASKDSVADVIKNFNGSQGVSNADRDFAVQVVGASLNGTRDQVLNSLTNNMRDIRNGVTNYNENARQHNENVKVLPEGTRKLLTARTVDKDFDGAESDFQNRYQAVKASRDGGSTPAKPAKSGGVVRYERRDGKIVRVED